MNETVLVVGASSDIGSAISGRLLDLGYRVVMAAHNNVETLREDFEGQDRATVHHCDVTDSTSVTNLAMEIDKSNAKLGAVVYAAGISIDKPLIMLTDEEWIKVIDVNLTGAFRVTKSFSKLMMRRKSGKFVFLGSITGNVGNIGQIAYGSSKAGLQGLVKTASLELAPFGIDVNGVAIGPVESRMTREVPLKKRTQILSKVPYKRFGKPSEIANIVAFLVGTNSAFITGTILTADGGLSVG